VDIGGDGSGRVKRSPRRRRWLTAVSVFLLVTATVAGSTSAVEAADSGRHELVSSQTVDLSVVGVGCVYVGQVQEAREYCGRVAEEQVKRRPLTGQQRSAAEQGAAAVGAAVLRAGWCEPLPAPACAAQTDRTLSRTPSAQDVEAVRRGLTGAGFTDVVVRLARADDPAPLGSIFYAVTVGPACVLGHVDGLRGGGSRWVAGPLTADGRCAAG
jgi:hypothetical protein